MDSPPESSGTLEALRRLLRGLVTVAQTRAELFSLELREETRRALGLLLAAGCAVALGLVGCATLTAAVVLFCPPGARPWVALALGLVYLLGAWLVAKRIECQLKHGPRPFEESLNQLRKDRECLQNRE